MRFEVPARSGGRAFAARIQMQPAAARMPALAFGCHASISLLSTMESTRRKDLLVCRRAGEYKAHGARLRSTAGTRLKQLRIVVQRVVEARVAVGDFVVGKIGPGLCLFLGVGHADDENSADQLAEKVKNLRIFDDAQGKMNLTLPEMDGEVLVISQFTLYGDCRKGNRPSFTNAAAAELAERLYRRFVERLRASGVTVATGQFQAKMRVSLINDGPATFILEG